MAHSNTKVVFWQCSGVNVLTIFHYIVFIPQSQISSKIGSMLSAKCLEMLIRNEPLVRAIAAVIESEKVGFQPLTSAGCSFCHSGAKTQNMPFNINVLRSFIIIIIVVHLSDLKDVVCDVDRLKVRCSLIQTPRFLFQCLGVYFCHT